ncbi:MAG: hypothetical protein ABFS56_15990 [Pseudomonadota bacterium]
MRYQKRGHSLSVWDDPVSREFEEKFMEPLAAQINQTESALEDLANVIDQAKRKVR